MKKVVFSLFAALLLNFGSAPDFSANAKAATPAENPKKNIVKHKDKAKPPARPKPKPNKWPHEVAPGSTVIWLKNNTKGEIRPDGTVWWYGVNRKKALLADGTHALKGGGSLTTKGGKLVEQKLVEQIAH